MPRSDSTGHVESVFDRACNIRLDRGGLISLLSKRAGNVAHGIRLANRWPQLGTLRTRTRVHLSRAQLVLDQAAIITLAGAPTWTPSLRPGIFDHGSSSFEAALIVRDSLVLHSKRSEFLAEVLRRERPLTPLALRLRELLPQLADASRSRQSVRALGAVSGLLGLGPGLTPAGDDFIIGWLAGLASLADTPERLAFIRAIGAGVPELWHATTAVSRQHLDDACALMFSERLSDLGVAIARGTSKNDLALRLQSQLAIGASSGADAAAGLVFAFFECGWIRTH